MQASPPLTALLRSHSHSHLHSPLWPALSPCPPLILKNLNIQSLRAAHWSLRPLVPPSSIASLHSTRRSFITRTPVQTARTSPRTFSHFLSTPAAQPSLAASLTPWNLPIVYSAPRLFSTSNRSSMKGYIQILSAGTADCPPSVVFHFDSQRYLINCGEGTQRLCIESKMRFSKLRTVLLTRTHWDVMGGLPGIFFFVYGQTNAPFICCP